MKTPTTYTNKFRQDSLPKIGAFAVTFYALVVLGVCVWAFKRPACNFDMFAYIASVEASKGKSSQEIFGKTVQAIPALTSKQREDLFSVEYRRDLLSNADHLMLALPIYIIKPLYVETIRVLERVTTSPIMPAILTSIVGYVGIAVLVWLLIGRQSVALATAIIVQPVLLQSVQLQTPDAFSTMWLVLGLFLYMNNRKLPGTLVLLGSVWIRPDSIVYVGCIFAALCLDERIDILEFATVSALALSSWFTISRFGYSWTILFYNSFIDPIADPTALQFQVTAGIYLHVVYSSLKGMWLNHAGLLLLLVIVGWGYKPGRIILLACVAGAVLHFVLFPSSEDRFYLLLYVMASIMAARSQFKIGRLCAVSPPTLQQELRDEFGYPDGDANPATQCPILRSITRNFAAGPAMIRNRT